MWDVTGLVLSNGKSGTVLKDKALDRYWDHLKRQDAAKAWQAIRVLAAHGGQSTPFLAKHLASRKARLALTQVNQLLADLDGADFERRERAFTDLAALGPPVVPALEKLRANPPSVEAKRRAAILLVAIAKSGLVSEEMLRRRVYETLEYIGTPAAKQVLRAEAEAKPASPLAHAAKAALERLAKRAPLPGS